MKENINYVALIDLQCVVKKLYCVVCHKKNKAKVYVILLQYALSR